MDLKWKTKLESGIGIYGPKCQIRKPLRESTVIFQAEIYAISLCAYINMKIKRKGATINIFFNSQAALMTLKAYTCQSYLVWEFIDALKQLAVDNHVHLYWVLGHEEIPGNEKADELGKKGASVSFTGPEPFCGVPKSHFKAEVEKCEETAKTSYRLQTFGQRHAKQFRAFAKNGVKELVSLSKSDLRLITNYLTGHCSFNYHLHKIGKVESTVGSEKKMQKQQNISSAIAVSPQREGDTIPDQCSLDPMRTGLPQNLMKFKICVGNTKRVVH